VTNSFRRFHAASLLLTGALACSSGGSGPAAEAPAPAVAPAKAPPVLVEPAPAPSFDGVATGNGWVDGAATAETSTRYFREVSGARGQVFELKGDALGDEKTKACGTDWRASLARSVALVTPDAGKGTVGFTLNATATAQRGFWRTKATLSCTTLNRTEAQAATMARGQAWITLGGGAADRDQLVIETAGATTGEWALSVTDTAGQKYPTDQAGSTLVATVPGAGRYSVAASVTARAATAGGKDSVEQRLRATVKVSSLRTTLASALGTPPLRNLDLPFSVDVPASALAGPIGATLAGYQPCAAKPGCAGKVSDLSVRTASAWAAGGGAVLELTLVGTKRAPLTIRLVGSTDVQSDSLRLGNLRLAEGQAQVSRKKDLGAAVALFAARASTVAAPLAPESSAAESALRARFPVRIGDLCLEVPAGAARFLGTVPAADSTAFRAVFGVTPSALQACGRSK
jgi:hypothetical protein